MSKAKTLGRECKVIAFEDVAINQLFESPEHVNFDFLFNGHGLVKRSREHYGYCDVQDYSKHDVGVEHFKNGCIVRIADCMSTQEIEPVKTLRDEMAILFALKLLDQVFIDASQDCFAIEAYEQADAMLRAREADADE